MNVFILGCSGQLGMSLKKHLKNEKYTYKWFSKSDLDITEIVALNEAIKKFRPKIIINASAYTNVEKASLEFEKCNLINNKAVENLAMLSKLNDIHLIHFSTDYIFNGKRERPYLETDKTNPINDYGRSKLLGELSIQHSGCKYSIIRTSWVYSEFGNNFLKTMLNLAKKNEEINVINDQFGCPTYASEIAKAVNTIIHSNNFGTDNEILNFSGSKVQSWYEFSQDIFKCAKEMGLKIPKKLHPVKSEEFNSVIKRPKFSVLCNKKIQAKYGVYHSDSFNCIKAAIKELKRDF